MSDATSHQSFMKQAIKFIMSLEVLDGVNVVTSRIKCLQGWLVSLNAILQTWDLLKTMYQFKFFINRRPNTDHIENFFGGICQQGGNSDNPTTIQFICAFCKLFFSSFLNSTTGCCEDLDSHLAGFSNDTSNLPVLVGQREQPNTLDTGATDYSDQNVGDCLIKANATCYVAGYVSMQREIDMEHI